jgi:hypothetical protein
MDQKERGLNWRGIIARLALVFGGLAFGVLLIVLIVRLFPQILPFSLQDPLDRRTPNATLDVQITELDGDLYHSSPGDVRPPEDPQLLAEFTANWDEDGFRFPAVQANHYPIIALGDSYTEGWLVEYPWPDILARELDTPVRNLGFLGWSIQQEAEIMRQYGQDDPEWVLLAYFEGNDLSEIHQTYHYKEEKGDLLGMLDRLRTEMFHPQITLSEDGTYKYPLTLSIGDESYEQGFHDYYFGRTYATRDEFEKSRNVAIFREGLGEIVDYSDDACVALIFLPTKAHLYMPYVDPEVREQLLESAKPIARDEEGWLVDQPGGGDYESWAATVDNQRQVIQTIAQELGIHFIDLTPEFEAAVAGGAMLYYTYDSHWNQAGHDLAGRLVAEYLEGHPDCSS